MFRAGLIEIRSADTLSLLRPDTGQWWVREQVGTYVRPVSLADFRDGARVR